MVDGIISPLNIPWIILKVISKEILKENAHKIDDTVKPIIANKYNFL
ncbi:hypothetical protein rsdtw13_14980 [Clostridium sp. TW13]|uniref:Uncharacterized protein n=1 Tax=Inconstantimicrobium mannanitabidum TaxID=1604901 RepID=A0ACB5RAM2_9CLOT|nr:hypothetical protein rsdtw13_14980 [Clostridium sp. TW13]